MWKKLLKAAKFARSAHGAQKRAHGAPYYTHPMAVARLLWGKGHREPALLMAAYLHDTLEDTAATPATLEALFGPETLALVAAVTKAPGEGREAYFARVKAAGPHAMALKLSDREHNNSELELAPAGATALREKAAAKTATMMKVFFGK